MNCDFDENRRCLQCGYVAAVPHLLRRCSAAGLGDRVELALKTAGVTKERVGRVAKMVGVSDCGCEKRKRWLNTIGKYLGIGNPTPSGPVDA